MHGDGRVTGFVPPRVEPAATAGPPAHATATAPPAPAGRSLRALLHLLRSDARETTRLPPPSRGGGIASHAADGTRDDVAPRGAEGRRLIDEEAAFGVERKRVARRRAALRESGARHPLDEHTVAIAVSGGGIRSATFALGVLRSLGRHGLLPRVDYLSTVSGGSYVGAFLCSHYVPTAWRGDVVRDSSGEVAGGGGNPFECQDADGIFDHLRQSGRYLLPGSSGDVGRFAAIATRNWLAVQAVIGVTLLTFFFTLKPIQAFLLAWIGQAAGVNAWVGVPIWLQPAAWLSGLHVGPVVIASVLLPVGALLWLVLLGLYWAYFLTRGAPTMPPRRIERAVGSCLLIGGLSAVVGPNLILWPTQLGGGIPWTRGVGILLTFETLVAVGAYLAAEWDDHRQTRGDEGDAGATESPSVQEGRVRTRLTAWAGRVLECATVLTLLGLVDSVAQTIYAHLSDAFASVSIGAAIAVAAPLLRQAVLPALAATSHLGLRPSLRKSIPAASLLAGLALLAAIGVFWALAAHALAWRGGGIGSLERWEADGVPARDAVAGLLAITLLLWFATIVIGQSRAFLNLSTFSSFYSSRLRRAYLGATNEDRYRSRDTNRFDEDFANDDIALERYYAEGVAAPVHLIGVTINDTASSSSAIIQRDRRGKPLTVSPAGFCYTPRSARDPITAIPFGGGAQGPDMLPLSAWVGISGAAASTGLGQYGSIGLSLLSGLSNVRLGQWWRPGKAAVRKRSPAWNSVQWRLKDEFIGRFPGSDQSQWYLTDGGHFENTGVYELVRRRVGFIVMCDNGADPDYAFGDLVSLTRRIKIDFDADLAFLGEDELDGLLGPRTPHREVFGDLPAIGLQVTGDARIGPYAALGRICYGESGRLGTLLLVKPRICGREAIDLVAYAKSNPPFPQQSTLDQSYDEAQWESQYRLGLLIADAVFGPSGQAGKWQACDLRPLPA